MLSKEIILEKTNRGLDVFKHYLSVSFRPGRNFLNPLYEDGKTSCNIYLDKNSNVYKIKDFGNIDYSGDCFFLVGKIYGLNCCIPVDFIRILEIINNDLNLAIESDYDSKFLLQPGKKECSFSYVIKKFTPAELEFWGKSGINEQVLKRFQVIYLQEYRDMNSEEKTFMLTASEKEPIYGYVKNDSIKLYRPFSNLRFLYGGKKETDGYCFGLEQLPENGEVLLLTGGEKDVMTLYAHGYNAICFNSETATIPSDFIMRLLKRFKHIIILYNVDSTGKAAADKLLKQFQNYGIKKLLLPL